MCKFNPKNDSRFIDPCMRKEIKRLNKQGIKTLACCCGHKKYAKTIVMESLVPGKEGGFEMFSKKFIPRKKRFYLKDKQGVYFILEVENG